ncbi:MAG: carboxypeptidase-like regulatory domain-containing protein [Proteobacteria bacterium]|nr:carboxypeptidase-like regulatory domain-containing protein [Pseudomonadota bacterium]
MFKQTVMIFCLLFSTLAFSKVVKGVGSSIINGTIQDEFLTTLESHAVRLYEIVSGRQQYTSETITDIDGNYSFNGLSAGNYAVHAGSIDGDYLNYLWNPAALILCTHQKCLVPTSSYIEVADASTVNNIDFTTKLGGKIQGIITDATSLLAVDTFTVEIVNTTPNPHYYMNAKVDVGTGSYSINGIPDGDYKIYLSPLSNFTPNMHIPQIHGGPECNACTRIIINSNSTVFNIDAANTVNNSDFQVNVGASVSGNLVDNDTLLPVKRFALVMLFNEFNYNLAYIGIIGTDFDPAADGSYVVGGLLPGSYYVQGGDLGEEFYQRELYNNRPCYYAGCDRGTGDAILLGEGEHISSINFLLNKGGKIAGNIIDEITGTPISLASNKRLQVEFYDTNEKVIGSANVQADGTYISARGLPAGDYSVRTGSMFRGELTSPYVNKKYNDIPCAGLACDLGATNVTVVREMTTSGIDFALTTGHSFSGTVTDLSTSAPIANIHVLVYKEMSPGVVKFANWATSSDGTAGNPPIGTFEISGLPDGTYYARTGYGSDLPFFSSFFSIAGQAPTAPIGWIDILYDGMPCLADCDVTLGTAIELPAALIKATGSGATVNFALNQGAIITGKVSDFTQLSPLQEITINVFNDQGVFMGSSITDDQGNYITRGLPAGTYYLTTSSFEVLLDVKYGNEFCFEQSCNPLDADPITITGLVQATDKDFILKTNYMHMFSDDFE